MLDRFTPPDVVKIDVEGAEKLVLAGSDRLLSEVRPRFYIEVGGEQNADVANVFRMHDYRLYDGDSTDRVELNECAFNTLAVPGEQATASKVRM